MTQDFAEKAKEAEPMAIITEATNMTSATVSSEAEVESKLNGIVSEAIYPRVSRDLGGIPIRSFYFDGTQSDLDRDLGVYIELARGYQRRKKFPRR